MKRTLGIAILSALILTGTAAAATEIQQQDAVFLDELGLFQGTERGYELDRTMTRAEGAVMLVRLLGGEAEAEVNVYQTPFTDVPDWAQSYVGWLYENKLTNGTSKTTYSPNESMRFEQYAWLPVALRALPTMMSHRAKRTYPPRPTGASMATRSPVGRQWPYPWTRYTHK